MTTVAYCAVSPNGRTFANQMYMRDELVPHLRAVSAAVARPRRGGFHPARSLRLLQQERRDDHPSPRGPSRTFNAYGIPRAIPSPTR